MNCNLRKWRPSDAAALAAVLNNEKVLNNLRDGLPFPYTERDASDYISAALSADENDSFAYAITADDRVIGASEPFARATSTAKRRSWATASRRDTGDAA